MQEHFGQFLRLLRHLPAEDQELLLSYYVLGKTQNTLATIQHSTQTVCSFKIRMARYRSKHECKLGLIRISPTPTVWERSE